MNPRDRAEASRLYKGTRNGNRAEMRLRRSRPFIRRCKTIVPGAPRFSLREVLEMGIPRLKATEAAAAQAPKTFYRVRPLEAETR